MILNIPMAKNGRSIFALCLLLTLTITFQSCKKSRSDMGKTLFLKTKNKVFKDVTPEGFTPIFQEVLAQQKSKLNNAAIISAYYQSNEFDPTLVMDHFPNDDVKAILNCYNKANQHGLDPRIFQTAEIDTLLHRFYNKKGIKNLNEAYRDIAQLELLLANSLINYSNAMQYGVINPRKIYARYFTQTKRPDSIFMNHVFAVTNFKSYLDSIQPTDPQYLAIQKSLQDGYTAPGMTTQETQRVLAVNLERLRWKNKPSESRYVIVNIPDFQLNIMNAGKSELNMKVCVGEGRNKDHANTLVEYDDSDKVDRPFSRETPQLNSMINEAQVNPVWNIPESIAGKEIIVEAQKDPYYLSNKNINVYKNGKLIEDPETIKWDANSATEYSFKQQPGADNSLGKIKFLFPNKSSVYLHDTPAKLAFNQSMRAISHGCVRLEKPLDFAKALFGDGTKKYTLVEKLMSEDKVEPTDLAISPKVPVYITYITCWADESGQLQFRPDVYGLDIVLFAHLQKMAGM
ncbi:MAG: L,D-transpeptidase family protein [Bacteroidota bacterium]